MKTYKQLLVIFLCTVVLFFNLFICYTIPVFAKPTLDEDGHLHAYNWDDIKDAAPEFIIYMASQVGAVVTADFSKYVQNHSAWLDYWKEDNVSISEDGKSVVFSQDLMAYIKQCIDQYAKEHEPYFFAYPLTPDELLGNNNAGNRLMYETAKNLIEDSPSGIIAFGADYQRPYEMYFVDIGNDFRNISAVSSGKTNSETVLYFYNNDTWGRSSYKAYKTVLSLDGSAVKTSEEFISKASVTYDYGTDSYQSIGNTFKAYLQYPPRFYSYVCTGSTCNLSLFTKEKRRIRIYNSYGDFQNYTLGKRNVYYTSEYYNYVPEDLTTSIDDLQKTVDDLSGVVDQLLDQVTKDTDESEIEELLKQILDELKNQQGTGGGGGTGGGDVNVDIDLSTTNGLLSKILAKVTQIFDKISETAGQTTDDVVNSINDLGTMLKKYLSEITNDLDDIKGSLENMSEQEFSDKSDSFLGEATESFSDISEVAKTKFPLSIPNDLKNIIAVFTQKPPEPEVEVYNLKTTLYGMSARDSDIIMITEGNETYSSGWSETGAPVFNLPIVVESVGWNYAIVVDLSDFQSVAKLCRTYMTLVYIWALLMLTIKVIGLWGELVD